MTDCIIVQTSIDSESAAQNIAETVVSRHLAACCWVSGPIKSTYWWEGKMEQAEEWVCNFKTRRELYEAIEQAIKEVHSYETPEIVASSIVAGSQTILTGL